jgi:hypothetical protein
VQQIAVTRGLVSLIFEHVPNNRIVGRLRRRHVSGWNVMSEHRSTGKLGTLQKLSGVAQKPAARIDREQPIGKLVCASDR